jgi:hypothetical protein
MYYCYGSGIKGVIALLNKLFKKAFDSVAHEFMEKDLHVFMVLW